MYVYVYICIQIKYTHIARLDNNFHLVVQIFVLYDFNNFKSIYSIFRNTHMKAKQANPCVHVYMRR